MPSPEPYDVAIIGGGPSGSTAGAVLRKYNPLLRVAIFERESFPRDHVGESQLPPISRILDEIGCWDKVEAANFPIKVGATYRWGKSPELWDFEFLPAKDFKDEARPSKFEGQRKSTAFQVDRAIYDKILLDHAAELGCEVFQNTKVQEVLADGESVSGIKLSSGETIGARYYLDASGHSGILRRALGVECEYPSSLQNIAIWDYWQNADWAVEIGVGGTRIQILSLGFGWIWFIPLGPTRTSIGLVMPAAYYKSSGKRPEELYRDALKSEPTIQTLMANATSENDLQTTKDWSFLAAKHVGPNWFLTGESAGFADPILSAGLTLSQEGAREAAYTILETDRNPELATWLREQFERNQVQRITSHIRFADYWYTANAQFTDLKEFTAQIAKDSGLDLSPDKAWIWLGQGGFIWDDLRQGVGGFTITEIKTMGEFLTPLELPLPVKKNNVFEVNLEGAELSQRAHYAEGRVLRMDVWRRGGKSLPLQGHFGFLVTALQEDPTVAGLIAVIREVAEPMRINPRDRMQYIHGVFQCFEAMITDGWLTPSYDKSKPLEDIAFRSSAVHLNTDTGRTAPAV